MQKQGLLYSYIRETTKQKQKFRVMNHQQRFLLAKESCKCQRKS